MADRLPGHPLPDRALIAMIGLEALPGSPRYASCEEKILESALSDLEFYIEQGVDAVLVENSGDLPYIKPPLADEACDLVQRICEKVRSRFAGPVGIQLLEAANLQALEIAQRTGLDFMRVEGYVFAHIGGAGLIEGCAGALLRRRKELNAESIRVFADVKKKHCSHAITGDLPLTEHIRQAEFFGADGLVITGPRTGVEPEISDLEAASFVSKLPRLIGSGMTPANIGEFFPHANGFIVGSCFRKEGAFLERLNPERLKAFMDTFQRLKSS